MFHAARLVACSLLLSACAVFPLLGTSLPREDATVVLATDALGELGVSTPYGIVFLGRGAHSGDVEFTAWFEDGPSFEYGIIEPLGGKLYLTEAEIVLTAVDLSFDTPAPGSSVEVRGRDADGPFRFDASVTSDTHIEGILLRSSSNLRALGLGQTGAGIYVEDEGRERLVGLLAGRVDLDVDGERREYFSVVGPNELWRLVTYRRDLDQPRRVPRRGDVVTD